MATGTKVTDYLHLTRVRAAPMLDTAYCLLPIERASPKLIGSTQLVPGEIGGKTMEHDLLWPAQILLAQDDPVTLHYILSSHPLVLGQSDQPIPTLYCIRTGPLTDNYPPTHQYSPTKGRPVVFVRLPTAAHGGDLNLPIRRLIVATDDKLLTKLANSRSRINELPPVPRRVIDLPQSRTISELLAEKPWLK